MEDDMPGLEAVPADGDEHRDDMPPLQDLTLGVGGGGPQASAAVFVMEEIPLEMIGVDRWGNRAAAQDPYLINRLTSGITTTMSLDTTTTLPYGPPAAQ